MKQSFTIVYFGKYHSFFTPAVEHYRSLLRPFAEVTFIPVPRKKGTTSGGEKIVPQEQAVMRRWARGVQTVALAPEGVRYDSEGFARFIQSSESAPLVFHIGDAFGLSREFKKRCRYRLSLSPLTFEHGLSQVVLLEQLYRAFTILCNHPYHK